MIRKYQAANQRRWSMSHKNLSLVGRKGKVASEKQTSGECRVKGRKTRKSWVSQVKKDTGRITIE
jgi:hypothetical protein